MKTQKLQQPVRLMAFACLPVTKADIASETKDFKLACERAEQKGDKAIQLLNECLPNPALVEQWAKDYGVTR
jgi:hypothetical protein